MEPLAQHREFLAPPDEIRGRIAAFQRALAAAGVAVAWIDHLTDRCYYAGTIQDGVLLVPAGAEPRLFARLSFARAAAESPLAVEPFPGRRGLLDAVRRALGSSGVLGLAFDVTPSATYAWLAGELGVGRVADVGGLIRTQRAVKSAWEIAQIRRAADQATMLFGEAGAMLRPGMTEIELSAALEQRLRLLGHGGVVRVRRPGAGLGMLYVVAGDGALYPTHFDGPVGAEGLHPYAAPGAGRRVIAPGQTVMLDVVTAWNGYHADTTRTFWPGGPLPPAAEHAHLICLEVLEHIEALMRPGIGCDALFTQVDAWVRGRGEPAGFMGHGDNQVKFFGHGVGLELDELPVLAARQELALAEGMVVAVEPKAFLPGIGPVGVENTYVITAGGCEPLCSFPREIVGAA